MPRVKMLKDTLGSFNGTTVAKYQKDHVYDVNKRLATHFIEGKHALLAMDEPLGAPAGEKKVEAPQKPGEKK